MKKVTFTKKGKQQCCTNECACEEKTVNYIGKVDKQVNQVGGGQPLINPKGKAERRIEILKRCLALATATALHGIQAVLQPPRLPPMGGPGSHRGGGGIPSGMTCKFHEPLWAPCRAPKIHTCAMRKQIKTQYHGQAPKQSS